MVMVSEGGGVIETPCPGGHTCLVAWTTACSPAQAGVPASLTLSSFQSYDSRRVWVVCIELVGGSSLLPPSPLFPPLCLLFSEVGVVPKVFLVSSLFAAFFPEQGSGGGGRGSASCSLLTHVLSRGSTSLPVLSTQLLAVGVFFQLLGWFVGRLVFTWR